MSSPAPSLTISTTVLSYGVSSFLESSFLEPEVFPNRRCHGPTEMSVLLLQRHNLHLISQAAHTVINYTDEEAKHELIRHRPLYRQIQEGEG